jgi:hypothetical protein
MIASDLLSEYAANPVLICTTCQRLISPQNISQAHVYRLGVYEPVTVDGQRAAVRIGTCSRALCRGCAGRIERGYQHRAERRRAIGERIMVA